MANFTLHEKLAADSYLLGKLDCNYLLLMRNAHFPWFVLVPETDKTDFHALNKDQQLLLLDQINMISRFVEDNFPTDKLNIGCIGNIVSQLHIHIVGRRKDDICWPNVVWGIQDFKEYKSDEVSIIREKLRQVLADSLQTCE